MSVRVIVFRNNATRSFEHYVGGYEPTPGPTDHIIDWDVANEDYDPYNYLRSGSSISRVPITRVYPEVPLLPNHEHVFNQLITVPGSPPEIFTWVPFWDQKYNHPVMPALWQASASSGVGWLTISWRAIVARWCRESGYPVD